MRQLKRKRGKAWGSKRGSRSFPVDQDLQMSVQLETVPAAMSASSGQGVAQTGQQAHSSSPVGRPETTTKLQPHCLKTASKATIAATAVTSASGRLDEKQVQAHGLTNTPSNLVDILPLQSARQIDEPRAGTHIPTATSPVSPVAIALSGPAVSHAASPSAGIDSTFALVDTAHHFSDHVHPPNPSTKLEIIAACSYGSRWSAGQSSPRTPRTAPALRPPFHALASSFSIPSPLTPDQSSNCTADDTDVAITLSADHLCCRHTSAAVSTSPLPPHSHDLSLQDHPSPLSQTSTYRTASTSCPITPIVAKPPASFCTADTAIIAPSTATSAADPSSSPVVTQSEADSECLRFYTPPTHSLSLRASSVDNSIEALSPLAARIARRATSPDNKTKEWASSQRELPPLRAVKETHTDANDKISQTKSATPRPHFSLTPPTPDPTIPGRIPPIRSFRSSGSRRSTISTMASSSYRYYDDSGDYRDPNHRDRSLRALEGRPGHELAPSIESTEMDEEPAESENNTADIFMRIAREDSASTLPRPKQSSGPRADEPTSTASPAARASRTPRQRPVSGTYNISTLQGASSSPTVARRLSDHQVPSSRLRRPVEDQTEQMAARDVSYQASEIGRPSQRLDSARALSRVSTLKPSPITPRTHSVLDNPTERSSIFARRPIPKSGDGQYGRSTSVRQPTGLSKSFNGSPLVHHEASESSNSTAAPSTVWDELDELKSRIHRLELTGKLPRTSGAAVSRGSDERPPTAGTGATTLSDSPKRTSGADAAPTEIVSTTSSHREAQPILRSALTKAKPFLSSEVFDAIDTAANDALSLAQMMAPVGQAGPISSGASTIGIGGPSTVTDRQLRKKADSICRSLTELCLALTEEGTQRRSAPPSRPQTQGTSTSRNDAPSSPPAMRVFTGRQSAGPEEPLPSIEGAHSPRATRLEKRATYNFTTMNPISSGPGHRYAASVVGGDDTITGRKSSLVIARARRGLTDEPDEQGRQTSLLRTRRAKTEEPEDDNTSTVLYPPRRVTTIGRVSNIDEEPQVGLRAPSRANTELGGGLRIAVPPRDSIARRMPAQEPVSASAAQPTRRLLASNLPTPGPYSSRLTTPSTPGARRFLQVSRQPQDREDTTNITGRLAEDRGQRYSIGGTSSVSIARTNSLHRKRNSGIPSISGTASNVGGYR